MVTHLPPPSGVGQTDACENITFARYATRAVKMSFRYEVTFQPMGGNES